MSKQTFKFKVHFDEIDTENWTETFTVSAENEDEAWKTAQDEARKRGSKMGHRHEFTLSIVD
jgi:hypothetical protein